MTNRTLPPNPTRPLVGRILAEALTLALVDPIRRGAPRPREWPAGVRTIGVVALAAYALVGLAIFAAPLIRRVDPSVQVSAGAFLGAWSITGLLWATTLALALATTALLHVHHAARWPGLVLLTSTLITFVAGRTTGVGLALGAVGLVGVWGLAVARVGRRFAPAEFAVALALESLVVLAPGAPGSALGLDLRGATLGLLLSSLFVLAMPALLMVGHAFTEVPIAVAGRLAERFAEHGRMVLVRLLALVAGALVAWRAVSGVLGGDWGWRTQAWVHTAAVLAVVAALTALLLRLRPGGGPAPRPADPTARWGGLAWGFAVLLVANAVPLHVAAAGETAARMAGGGGWPVVGWLGSTTAVVVIRLAAVTAGLLLAWRAARRGDALTASVLAAFAVVTGVATSGMLTGGRWLVDLDAGVAGVWLAAAALAVAVARWQVPAAWTAALGVLLVVLLHPLRQLLSEPAGLVAAISAPIALFLGLLWTVLTEGGQFARKGTRAFPHASRVLLYLANALFGAIVLAYVALVRTQDGTVDVKGFTALGDRLLGVPLFVGVACVGIAVAATASRPPVPAEPADTTDPTAAVGLPSGADAG
ncbi:hypothetical protein GCM10027418_21480 [Mariniluteicoccus endophyticus]